MIKVTIGYYPSIDSDNGVSFLFETQQEALDFAKIHLDFSHPILIQRKEESEEKDG